MVVSVERVKELALCFMLPFLMKLDVGYGIYILGAAYYTALMEKRSMRGPAVLAGIVGLIFLDNGALRWKYGTLLLLLTVWEWVQEVYLPTLVFWKKALAYECLLILTVLLLVLTQLGGVGRLSVLLAEGLLLGGFAWLYHRMMVTEQSEMNPLEQAVLAGSFLAGLAYLQMGSFIPAEMILLCLGMKVAYEREIGEGLLLSMPAAAFMRLTGMGSDGLMILCLVLQAMIQLFRGSGVVACLIGGGSAGILYLLLFMKDSLVVGLLTLAGALLFWSLWVRRDEETIYCELPEKKNREWQRYLERRLERSAGAFAGLADLMPMWETRKRLSERDTAYLMENVAGRVCGDCSRKADCWSTHFSLTQETIQQIMEASGEKGRIEEQDLPEEFRGNCGRTHEFVKMVNRHFELYRLNLSWENRMGKGRELIRRQYEGIAEYLENLRSHIAFEVTEEVKLRMEFKRFLHRQRFEAGDPWVAADQQEDSVTVSFCYRGDLTEADQKRVQEFLTEIIGRGMMFVRQYPEKGGWHRCVYRDQDRIRLETAALQGDSGKVSGDSYIMGPLDEHRYVLAISDGMGSGARARNESRKTLRMLEQYLLAGMSETTAVSMLNTTLVLGAHEESFATVDMAVVNLHRGRMRLVKAGAVTTYLCSRGRVRVCRGESLPVGLLEDPAAPEIFECELRPGDCIVMLSDGVLDQAEDARIADQWIRRYLPQAKGSPRAIIEEMQEGLAAVGVDKIGDDKTILIAVAESARRR